MSERYDPAIEENVRRALGRVTPPKEFRAHLRENLRAAAEYRAQDDASRGGALWLLGAAIIGAVFGLSMMLLRARRLR